MKRNHYDVVVIGAGAAGMMCASVAAQRGKSVLLLDAADKLAEKIRISGGGRCNFTNLGTGPANFLSENPHFCKSALARYTPQDFLTLLKRYGVRWHEKHKGQLFCDDSAEQIISMLKAECDAGGVDWRMPCKIAAIRQHVNGGFEVDAEGGAVSCNNLVIATGGLSIPKIGATDFGYQIAKQFDLAMIAPRPALVPLTFGDWQLLVPLAGVALEVEIACGEKKTRGQFLEDLLFTHRGLSGPAVLQISSYWQPGQAIDINLLPKFDMTEELLLAKSTSKKNLQNLLSQWMPARLAETWLQLQELASDARPADMQDKVLRKLGSSLNQWRLVPSGSEGYRKAEVTRGGVDTRELSQQSMMAKKVPRLYFIGEVVDVTGWLGGYNFQWAWASGVAAGLAISA